MTSPPPPVAPVPDDELDELVAVAERLAVEAAGLVRTHAPAARRAIDHKTSATDLVTAVDRAAEALIVDGLRTARPHDTVVGEEGGAQAGASPVRWLVDPIDGTTNFVYGLAPHCVSIGAEVHGRRAVGVVVEVTSGELFSAATGRGSRLDGDPIHCAATGELATALVATGFGYRADDRAVQAAALVHVLPVVRDIRRGGSAAFDLCSVACGRVDAYFERHTQPWDVAAGLLLCEEAGVATAAVDGGPARPGDVVAATPALLGPLLDLLRAAGA